MLAISTIPMLTRHEPRPSARGSLTYLAYCVLASVLGGLLVGYAHAQNIIQPTVSAYSSQNPYGVDRTAARTRDGSGLAAGSSGILGAADSTHGRVANGTMWTTEGDTGSPTDSDPSITYDLGGTTNLQTLRIWNYNENTFTRFGAKGIRVSTSPDNTTFTVLGNIALAQGGSTTAEPAQDFAAAVSAIRYVKLQILTNWDGASLWSSITGVTNSGGADNRYLAGLSEVRFVGSPTPPPADAVTNPGPVDAATGIEPDTSLSWDANNGDGAATGYRVSIGVGDISYNYLVHTATVPVSASSRMTWQPPANVIQKGSSFWWRVDKVTAAGTVASPVWTFATRPETTVEKDARMAWFRHGKFFGAIVWGLYSGAEGVWPPQTGTKDPSWTYAEWMQFWKGFDTLYYRNTLEPSLTGTNFDATQMARMCKDAGMEMVYVMPRHHDGYAIWNTATSTTISPNGFKIANSPFNPTQRDYLKELVDALHAEGLRVGFYFSLGDWHHPDFPRDGSWAHPRQGQTIPGADWNRYVAYLHQQVREIVDPNTGTDYGTFDAVYFDYSTDGINGEEWGATKLVHMVRQYQPNIIINNRLWNGLDNPNGDYATPEANVANVGYHEYDRDWEAIMSANEPPTWGYGRPDLYPFKSSKDLAWDIVDVASKGGTIELSVSPKGDGSLHPDQLSQYAGLGAWMRANGVSIKGTTGNPAGSRPAWGEYTSKRNENRLYLHVFNRPTDGNIVASGLYGTINRAWLLSNPTQLLTVTPRADGFQVFLPAETTDPIDTVIGVDYIFPASPATTITVAGVSSENVLGLDRDASHTVDSSGLVAGNLGALHAEGEDAIVWTTVGSLGPGTDFAPFITFDLGEVVDIMAIREWGYNAAFLTGGSPIARIGPKDVDVYGSLDGVNFIFAGAARFARAPGVNNYQGNTVAVNLPGVRYIRLNIRTNHDGAVFNGTGTIRGGDGRSLTGLSEIRFQHGPAGFPVTIRQPGFNGSSFHLLADGLDLGRSYRLTRSLNLGDGFPTTVDGPRAPNATIDAFTDPAPPATRAFYRIEEATP
jgi:alpha-L-fucosidase